MPKRKVGKTRSAIPKPAVTKKKVTKKKVVAKKTIRKKAAKKGGAQSILVGIQKKLPKIKDSDRVFQHGSDDSLSKVTEWIPTGFAGLDYNLGGGWPVGRASEVAGPPGCGKSALSQMAILGNQSIGGVTLILDFELATDPEKLDRLGIREESYALVYPRHIEEAWDIIYAALDACKVNPPDAPLLIVWDSIPAAPSKAQYERKTLDKKLVATQANAFSDGVKRMYRYIALIRAHMMWVNQERVKMNAMSFGPQTKTTGSAELAFAATARVRCVRVNTEKVGTYAGALRTGYRIKTTTDKCRGFPPHRQTEWVLDFEHGPSPELTMWAILVEANLLCRKPKRRGIYVLKGDETEVKKVDWIEVLKENTEFRKAVEAAYMEVNKVGGVMAFNKLNEKSTEEDHEVVGE